MRHGRDDSPRCSIPIHGYFQSTVLSSTADPRELTESTQPQQNETINSCLSDWGRIEKLYPPCSPLRGSCLPTGKTVREAIDQHATEGLLWSSTRNTTQVVGSILDPKEMLERPTSQNFTSELSVAHRTPDRLPHRV